MRIIILIVFMTAFCLIVLMTCKVKSQKESSTQDSTLGQVEFANKDSSEFKKEKYSDLPIELSFDGELAIPIIEAMRAFEQDEDIPKLKKNLSNYNIEVRKSDESFFVSFFVKRQQNPDRLYEGGSTDDGKDVTYIFNRKERRIVSRGFYK